MAKQKKGRPIQFEAPHVREARVMEAARRAHRLAKEKLPEAWDRASSHRARTEFEKHAKCICSQREWIKYPQAVETNTAFSSRVVGAPGRSARTTTRRRPRVAA